MNRYLLRGVALFAVMTLLMGCGGGNSRGGSSTGGGSGGSIAETRRAQIIAAVVAKWSAMPRTTQAADSRSLQVYLKTFPEFVSTGISPDNTVWGIFSDGIEYVIANNEPYDQFSLAINQSGDQGYTRQVPNPATTRAVPTDLPGGTSARLYYMFGTIEGLQVDPRRNSVLGQGMEAMLQQVGGYDIDVAGYPGGVTIASMRQPRHPEGDAVIYTGSHGMLYHGFVDGSSRFALWTDQAVNSVADKSDTTLQQDLAVPKDASGKPLREPRVIIGTADEVTSYQVVNLQKLQFQAVRTKVTHYAITGQFVTDYMKFAPGSVWYNDACEGDADPKFAQAAFAKGLSAYLGWDMEVYRPATNNIARLFFDRLAGTNLTSNWPEAPPQRPFDIQAVYQDMEQRNITSTPGYTGTANGTAHLSYDANSQAASQFGLLAPSIELLSVDEGTEQLYIQGLFGNDPGAANRQVTINGSPLTVVSGGWTPTQITCTIPATGANASGDVQVKVRNHASNIVQLSLWKGTFTYTAHGGNDGVANPLFQTVQSSISVQLRTDIHAYREVPHQTPAGHVARRGVGVGSFNWNFSGQMQDETLQGSGSRTLDVKIPLSSTFSAGFDIDKHTVSFQFDLVPNPAPTITSVDSNGNPTSISYHGIVGTSNELAPAGKAPQGTLNADGTIAGGTINFTTQAIQGKTYQTSLSWSDMKPVHPPDPNAAR